MNTLLYILKRFILVGALALPVLSLFAQSKKDTIPVSSSEIIRQYGKSITLPVNEKAQIQARVKRLVDSCLINMTLCEESSVEFDERVIEKFKGYFDNQVLEKKLNAIPNYFQPRPPGDTTVFKKSFTVQEYIDNTQRWFRYIEITPVNNVITNDYFYKYRGERYTYAQVSIEFQAPAYDDPNARVDEFVNLNFWINMSKQKIILENGEEVPVEYKIRFLEVQPADTIIEVVKKYKNRWGFLNLNAHGGINNASFKALNDYPDLNLEPAGTYGVLGSFTLFASDTFTVSDNVRLWEYGLDLGVGYDHMAWKWKMNSYENLASDQTVSPLNSLSFENYNLLTEITGLEQEESFDILSVPLSVVVKRYFSPRKVNSLLLKAGVSFNYLFGNSTEITSGTVSYTGEDCSFQDPVSGNLIEGVTIDDLPYYGFGNYDAALTSTKYDDVYEPYYLSAHVKLALDLRKNRNSRLHWVIAPYFYYAFTEFRSGNSPADIIEPGGYMTDISAATTAIKPYNFGLEFGISYNIKPNNLKNVRIRK
jgi:hypothetical protein